MGVAGMLMFLMASLALAGCHQAGAHEAPAGPRAATVTLSAVQQLIEREGAATAVRQLSADREAWSAILDHVSRGEESWLEIAARFRTVSDGSVTLALEFSIQDALLAAPEKVLRVIAEQRGFTVQEACGSYGSGQIEDERPTQVILDLVLARIEGVRRIDAPMLAGVRNACLQELEELAEIIRRSEGDEH